MICTILFILCTITFYHAQYYGGTHSVDLIYITMLSVFLMCVCMSYYMSLKELLHRKRLTCRRFCIHVFGCRDKKNTCFNIIILWFNWWFVFYIWYTRSVFIVIDEYNNKTCGLGNLTGNTLAIGSSETSTGLLADMTSEARLCQILACVFTLGWYSSYYSFYERIARGYNTEVTRIRKQASLLAARVNDIELMSSAWLIRESEIQMKYLIDRGGNGEVWYACLRGKYEVAVKRVFNSQHVDIEHDDEIRFLQRVRIEVLFFTMLSMLSMTSHLAHHHRYDTQDLSCF